MDSNQLISGGIGAALGYVFGNEQGKKTVSNSVPSDLAEVMNQLAIVNQQNDLYEAQIAALTALREIDQATGEAADLARQSLQTQVASLSTQLAQVQTTIFNQFPVVLGKGDPAMAGWIKGRDGLLVSRPLANLMPTGLAVGTTTNDNWDVDGTELSVSNILTSMPARNITIGRNMNTQLHINLPRGCDLNVAVVLSFNEDVGDDLDFMASARINGLWQAAYVEVRPIGRNSLMIIPIAPFSYYSTEGYVTAWCRIKNGHNGKPSDYVAKDKWSANPSYRSRLILSHRSARQLALRSVHMVANPYFAENDSHSYLVGISQADMEKLRPTVDSAQLQRLTVGINPRFLRINDMYNLVAQDVPSAQYVVA